MGILDELQTPSCATCHWWSPQETGGECHHRSPMGWYDAETGKYYATWPLTGGKDWCGDHQYNGVIP